MVSLRKFVNRGWAVPAVRIPPLHESIGLPPVGRSSAGGRFEVHRFTSSAMARGTAMLENVSRLVAASAKTQVSRRAAARGSLPPRPSGRATAAVPRPLRAARRSATTVPEDSGNRCARRAYPAEMAAMWARICATAAAPSPMAPPTRVTDPERTSPTANHAYGAIRRKPFSPAVSVACHLDRCHFPGGKEPAQVGVASIASSMLAASSGKE